jgi:diguanylate cyclase (GGDEF)-like protein/PAS domain S-box-containing protein
MKIISSTIWRFLLPVLILLAVAPFVLIKQQSSQQLGNIETNARAQARTLVSLLNVTNELVGEQANSAMRLLKERGIALGEPTIQGTVVTYNRVVPNIIFGETPLINNFKLVDELSSIVGGTATLFVKSGKDFIRVTTNVRHSDESRAVGTKLNPDGKAIVALHAGQTFQGVVDILDEPYITRYDPIYDGNGGVIGAYYVGYKVDMKVLRDAVENSRQLKTGFAMVLDDKNKIRFISSHMQPSKAIRLWHDKPENWTFVRESIPNWGFEVVVAYPLSEARAAGLANSWFIIVASTVLGAMLIIIILWQLRRLILNPIGGDPALAIDVVRRITAGDLENDGIQAKPNTLMANVLRMRLKLRETMGILRENADRMSLSASVFDHAHDGIFITDAETRIVEVNQAFTTTSGYAREYVLGRTPPELGFAIHDANIFQQLRDGSEHTAEWRGETWNRHKNGKPYAAWLDIFSVRDHSQKITNYIGLFSDITESKLAEDDLRIAATAFETQDGIIVTNANNIILRANSAFSKISGYSANEVIGKTPSMFSSGQHNASFYAEMWERIKTTGAWEGEIWNQHKNGKIYPLHLTITAVKDQDGAVTNYVATSTDITLRKAAEDEIKSLAFYDPLTHLPNRRLLVDRLNQALVSTARSGKDGALLFLDLDHFKTLNDTLGHDTGDLLLQQVANRLTSCVREGDTVARLGGDEYVVMLEDLSEHAIEAASQAEVVGEKILSALNQPYQLASYEYHSTPSIGVALFSDHNQSQEELLKHADIAMYQAKKAGRNTLRFFDPHMQDAINTRVDLERELRKALENKQFQLYYQIQIDSSQRCMGAEALIRWIHPARGLVSPYNFIPLAEETGLIVPIGQWILETACAQLNAWQQVALTRDLTLSINVSAKQFHQTDFVTQVQAAIQLHAINPMMLKFELTESMLLDNVDSTIATMNALKEIGIRFSLDDFGTGYSSLQYLKRLPLYQLKIDQSFVRDIAIDSSDQAIVRTIIAMAHTLNLNVIAEGVETAEQQELLLNNGCTHYQGYLFGRPVPIDEFEAALQEDL